MGHHSRPDVGKFKWGKIGCRMLAVAVAIASAANASAAEPSVHPAIQVTEAAGRLHRSSLVIDGHNDLPWAVRQAGGFSEQLDIAEPQPQLHTDIPRLQQGGVGAQFWSVYVPVSTRDDGVALRTTLEQIALVKQMVDRYPKTFEIALGTEDIERIRRSGKIASMIGVEGGHSIENSLSVLRQLYAQGARYMTLTHSATLDWADSCTDDPRHGGLSSFGEAVVLEMNRLGMLVDISHVSADCMRHTLRVTQAPVIFSHSSAAAIAEHPRNVPDDVLRLTAQNGGLVMINFFRDFVDPQDAARSVQRGAYQKQLKQRYPDDPALQDSELKKWEVAHPPVGTCTAHDVLDHIEHVIAVAGIDHVGLGADFDGVPAVPKQLEDVSSYPVITQGLLDRGYSEDQVRKVLGENLMRVFRQTEQVAEQLQQQPAE